MIKKACNPRQNGGEMFGMVDEAFGMELLVSLGMKSSLTPLRMHCIITEIGTSAVFLTA